MTMILDGCLYRGISIGNSICKVWVMAQVYVFVVVTEISKVGVTLFNYSISHIF